MSTNHSTGDEDEPEITSIIRILYRQRQKIKNEILNGNKTAFDDNLNGVITFDPAHLIPGIAVVTDEETCRVLWNNDNDNEEHDDDINSQQENDGENTHNNNDNTDSTPVTTFNCQADKNKNYYYSNHSEKSKVEVEIEDEIDPGTLFDEYLQENAHLKQTPQLRNEILPIFNSQHLNNTNINKSQCQLQRKSQSQSSGHEIKETVAKAAYEGNVREIEIESKQVEEKQKEDEKQKEQTTLTVIKSPLSVQTVELKSQIPQIEQLVRLGKERISKLDAVKKVVERYENVKNTILTSTDDKQLFVVKIVLSEVGKPVDESTGLTVAAFGWTEEDAMINAIQFLKIKEDRTRKYLRSKTNTISRSDITDASVFS